MAITPNTFTVDVQPRLLDAVHAGLTPEQQIRAEALNAATLHADFGNTVEQVLNIARHFAAWLEHGDQAEPADPDRRATDVEIATAKAWIEATNEAPVDYDDPVTAASYEEALALLVFAYNRAAGQPRTWALPDEPGPEVTAVRNDYGTTWTRVYSATGLSGWYPDGMGVAKPWRTVLLGAPLTDATAEHTQAERPTTGEG